MTKFNIFLIEDCEREAAEIIGKLNEIAGKRENPEYSFNFEYLKGTRQVEEYEGERRSFYEPVVLEDIRRLYLKTKDQNEKMGILLDVLLTQEEIESTMSSYYAQADLARRIYFEFHDRVPIYVITSINFATQSDVVMGVDLSEQFIAKYALLKYELKQDIDKLFRFYENDSEKH